MLLTLTATADATFADASDLGYLLHKHPDRVQTFDVFGGTATVLYPEVATDRTTVALVLEVDPVALVRTGRKGEGFSLAQYVNDRPYAATSSLSVAMGKVFRSALNGQCKARPELAELPIDLEVRLPSLPTGGPGTELVERLFAPLDWQVDATSLPLDPEPETSRLPAWGDSAYADVTLTGRHTLSAALSHLWVLIPVLDGAKHYFVDADEVDKLVRAGAGWLGTHPERELISRRFLARQRSMADEALTRLAELDGVAAPESDEEPERPRPLVALRHDAVLAEVARLPHTSVVDLGCGQGALLRGLLELRGVDHVVGTEVSAIALAVAERRLHVDQMTERQADRLDLWLSSLQYEDPRLIGFDCAVLMEVVEHVDPPRLPAVMATLLGFMRPASVVLTTPNREHNALYPALLPNGLRHPDHRFEWTRDELTTWATATGDRHGYDVTIGGIGPVDDVHGTPTQLVVMRRREGARS